MLRTIFFTVCAIASLSSQATADFIPVSLSMPDTTGATGGIVDVPIRIDNSVSGLNSFDIYVKFDDNKVTLNPLTDVFRGSLLPSGWTIQPNPSIIENPDGYAPGDYLFISGYNSGTSFSGGPGPIVDIKFKVLAADGVIPLTLSGNPDNLVGGLNEGGIHMTTTNGSITVTDVPEPAVLSMVYALAAFIPVLLIRARRCRKA
jgi:hypothetical protein